jgi:alkanesulfonate monooxygenase SsuD/methylene tetrahydromethanopterin reductase-like flavin-dependent oxidoreductase (luciferase family)
MADQGGIDILFVPDHVRLPDSDVRANGGAPGVDEPLDCWPLLASLAVLTDRVRLGSAVSPVPLRHPVLIAHAAATVDRLSTGRALIGLGAGWFAEEFDQAGLGFAPHPKRLAQTREGAGIVRRLLAGGAVTELGNFYNIVDASVGNTLAGQCPPIWFAGRSERLLELVADLGDGWITTTNPSPEDVAAGIARLSELLAERGRDRSEITVAATFITRVADTNEIARHDIEEYIERGAFSGFIKEFYGESTLRYGLWGSVDECRRRLEPYLRLGVDVVIADVRPPRHTVETTWRLCERVLPLLTS